MGDCNINCQCRGPMGGNQRPLLKLESCLPHRRASDRCHQNLCCCWGPVIDDIPVNTGSHIINDNVWLSYFDITNNDRNKVLFQGFQNLFMKSKRSKRVLAPCKIFDVELDVPRSVATRTIRLTYIENVCSATHPMYNVVHLTQQPPM